MAALSVKGVNSPSLLLLLGKTLEELLLGKLLEELLLLGRLLEELLLGKTLDELLIGKALDELLLGKMLEELLLGRALELLLCSASLLLELSDSELELLGRSMGLLFSVFSPEQEKIRNMAAIKNLISIYTPPRLLLINIENA